MVLPLIILFSGCSQQPTENHQILGSRFEIPKSEIIILSDSRENGLRIKHVRFRHKSCAGGILEFLEFDGEIGDSSTFLVEQYLRRVKPCQNIKSKKRDSIKVFINSSGGLLKDGYALGKLFRKYEVSANIVNGQSCSSACAIAFLGAKYRSMSKKGKIMFHAPYIRKVGLDSKVKCMNKNNSVVLKQYYVKALGKKGGIAVFENTMRKCSISGGWMPNQDAAKMYGIINS